ncbi:SGNH/GDSL hydrolase family protein [Sphingomonas jatrophae]|uniref:GDSL-like Lipase/Acylhydrolase family protein n=1 Tax=Sphingomonas jatrophae TaxID=1166337 RepID=A0A1I6K505_9SPHN|nr:SGNH/GDSL hydrolase family protein [Sphingomonas jatrophae]SFR86158.1 hypothetical protein SAMN05192580_1322 [Sphingomonas jatrophae]
MLAGVALGLVTGFILALRPWQQPRSDYTALREDFVRSNLELAMPADTLVLGDSVSESVNFEQVCGTTFNAGIGGAKVPDAARLAPLALARIRPRTVILAIGTNHFWDGPALTDAFRRDYLALARSLPGRKIIVGVPNSAPASAFMRQVAAELGASYVAPLTGKLTRDGVHLTIAGARLYRDRIAAACAMTRAGAGSTSS